MIQTNKGSRRKEYRVICLLGARDCAGNDMKQNKKAGKEELVHA
jgi:hypothetical protein